MGEKWDTDGWKYALVKGVGHGLKCNKEQLYNCVYNYGSIKYSIFKK